MRMRTRARMHFDLRARRRYIGVFNQRHVHAALIAIEEATRAFVRVHISLPYWQLK